MTTITFIPNFSTQSVDWDDPTIWSGAVVPNDPSVDVVIPLATVFLTGAPYVSTVTATGTHAINSLTISKNNLNVGGTLTLSHGLNLSGGVINIGNGSSLTVGDSLDLTANAQIVMGTGSVLVTGGSLNLAASTELLMASGSSLQVGSLDNNGVDIQSSGSIVSSGLFLNETKLIGNGLSLTTAGLTNIGSLIAGSGDLTVTVDHGGFTNLSGSTLTGGAYVAADSKKLYLNVGSVVTTNAANISLTNGGAVYFFDDISGTYVPITSSLHSVAASGILSLAGGTFDFGDLTVDGSVTLTSRPPIGGFTFPSAELVSSGVTINAGGHVTGEGIISGPIVNFGTISAGQTSANGLSLRLMGPVSGSGMLEVGTHGLNKFGPVAEVLELGAAASSNVVFLDHLGTLILDAPTSYTGQIAPNSGTTIILTGINANTVTNYNYFGDTNGGILTVQTTSGAINLGFSGDFVTENFTLDAVSGGLQISNTGTAHPTGTVSINDVSIVEGDSGTKLQTFTVTRTGGAAAFTVRFATADGTATVADHDYAASFGTLNFAAGVNTQTISIAINGDAKVEPNEFYSVVLSAGTHNVTIGDGTGLGAIVDDDNPLKPIIRAAPANFNGDGPSDILWRNDDGNVGTWDMNGNQVLSTFAFGQQPAGWKIAGTGDFNGDGKTDILWRHDDGNVGLWTMNDHQIVSSFAFGQQPAGWEIAGTGDFNGDGKSDMLWRHDDGNVGLWTMNDHQIVSSFAFGQQPDSWHIAGAGDFNGDGKSDILWRNDDGNVGTWDMNGNQVLSTFAFGIVPNAWQIVGTGDFNGDGKSDILWHNADGNVSTWDMNDHQVLSAFAFGTQPNAWHIAGTGDFNGDGKSDILWRHDDGNVGVWNMNDHQIISTFQYGQQPDGWHIV